MGRGRRVEIADRGDLDGDDHEHDAEHDGHPLLERVHPFVTEQSEHALQHQHDKQPDPERHVDQQMDRLGAEDGVERVPRNRREPLQDTGKHHRTAERQSGQRNLADSGVRPPGPQGGDQQPAEQGADDDRHHAQPETDADETRGSERSDEEPRGHQVRGEPDGELPMQPAVSVAQRDRRHAAEFDVHRALVRGHRAGVDGLR